MPAHRKSIAELALTGSGHLDRALKLRQESPAKILAKRAELLRMYAEVEERRNRALEDLRKRGEIVVVTKCTSKGEIFQTEALNPALRVVTEAERIMLAIARTLSQFPTGESEPEQADDEGEFMRKYDHLFGGKAQ